MDPAVISEMDELEDGIAFRASRNHAHHTWAQTFHSSPELYIRPQSVEEIQKAITLARRCRRRIATVGCGHSPSDLTCTSSWQINLDDFNKLLSVDKSTGIVVMQAGIRLYQLSAELDKVGLAMPNLGSINQQSIAGAISTGTHGSALRHGALSSSILSLRIALSDSRVVTCSPSENLDLFRAALLSLGALGIITEITFQAVPAFNLHWQQKIYPDTHIFETWSEDLWKQTEFVRVWWFPYTRRATVWAAEKTDRSPKEMQYREGFYDGPAGYYIYHNLLALAQYVPRILPWVEWFVFGLQYGFGSAEKTNIEAIQPGPQALLMNCLYSQYVNEWAIPLHLGPIALRRLSSWLNHLTPDDPDYVEHGIPYSADGLWVHAPVEVRVSDNTAKNKFRADVRAYLDNTCTEGPTLYLNATLYRPYNMDPPCRARYYQGFEYLMRDLGGKPHWAKNFDVSGEDMEEMFGKNLLEYRRVRADADPDGMFVGPWHRRYALGEREPRFDLEEVEIGREKMKQGGVKVLGQLMAPVRKRGSIEKTQDKQQKIALKTKVSGSSDGESVDQLSIRTGSESSFDMLQEGEGVESQILMPQFRPNS
ncbi:MAG: D-arabinono-1,4-lactone oxidase [Claussenomyces sp. TS43310]|nr:MAG: D-arabinono-1,4-lactone oxidase [Claussenomyces sp. TS43310]